MSAKQLSDQTDVSLAYFRKATGASAGPRVTVLDDLYVYEIDEAELAHGSSLGNAKAWATSKGTGAIEGLHSIDVGKSVLGSLVVGYFVPHHDLSHFGCPRSPLVHSDECDRLVMLSQTGSAVFQLHPAYQKRTYHAIGDVDVSETFFLPRTGLHDDAAALQLCELRNQGTTQIMVSVIGCLDLVGNTSADVRAEYDTDVGGLVAWNASEENWARAFCSVPQPDRYMATSDIEESYDPGAPLPNTTDERGRIVGSLQVDVVLPPGEAREVAFLIAFSPQGREALRVIRDHYKDYWQCLQATINHYRDVLGRSDVVTPDTVINQGCQWAKTNMLRVLADAPFGGISFTNDPGRSSNVVARDVAWYVHGSDYVTPRASCTLLSNLARLQQDSGKIVEYYNSITGDTDDYGLNINDNTPLFVLAAAHHLNATGHRRCIEHLYPAIAKAGRYIVSQQDDRGLVFCTARGNGVHGIAGWRNVIEEKNISGAVTEINAECYAALRALEGVASSLGKQGDYRYFSDEADRLRKSINDHLLNPRNGTYYLNIDPDGNIHTEVTADEVFPLLFGVTDDDTARLISTRLSSTDFMTSAGLRTVPAQNPLYAPDQRVGLEGGVWPGVTWWYALAASTTDPSLMADALRSSYRHYIENPGVHNTVPGQFSEWFDGQSLVNRGMRLSPWEPPRFLWALLEGAVGLEVKLDKLTVNPRIPPTWNWLLLRDLPYHERKVSFFMARLVDGICFYTTSDFDSRHTVERYSEDVSARVRSLSADMQTSAMLRDGDTLICLASTAREKQTAALQTEGLFAEGQRYWVKMYSSETGDWTQLGPYDGRDLGRLSAWIEPGGFSLMEITSNGG